MKRTDLIIDPKNIRVVSLDIYSYNLFKVLYGRKLRRFVRKSKYLDLNKNLSYCYIQKHYGTNVVRLRAFILSIFKRI